VLGPFNAPQDVFLLSRVIPGVEARIRKLSSYGSICDLNISFLADGEKSDGLKR
jgi:hypothetical protein